eukprot:SAG11_NODE_42787_length_175_cov_21.986842_1_plen_58_part_11
MEINNLKPESLLMDRRMKLDYLSGKLEEYKQKLQTLGFKYSAGVWEKDEPEPEQPKAE